MSAPGLKLVSPPMRWIGHCHGCRRDDREVQTYYEHSAKTLCDACAERLNGKSVLGTRKQELGERGSRTTGSPKSLPTSSFLLPLSELSPLALAIAEGIRSERDARRQRGQKEADVVPWAHSWSIERAGASSVGRSYEAITELRDAGVLELVYRLTRSKTNCYRLLGS